MATILAPLDGSALAEAALPHARLLATTLEADVILLRVLAEHDEARRLAVERADAWDDTLPPHAKLEQQIWQLLREEAEAYLATQAEGFREGGLNVETRVVVGEPAATILAQVAAIRPTLVVTASHGYSGLRRWALGSVTDRVVSTSAAPVLVVRGDTAVMPPALRRILVPLDGSQRSAQALPFALLLARCAGAQLTLLSVLEPPVAANPYLTAQCRELVELKHAQALGQLKATASALRAEHGAIAAIIGKGYPAEEIVATAERQGVDLIVMATHGYSGFQRWALGSVADKVLHASSTPLILVRSQDLMGERGPREARRE